MDALFRAIEVVGGTISVENEESGTWLHRVTTISFAGNEASRIRLRESNGVEMTIPSWVDPGGRRTKLILDNGLGWTSNRFHLADSLTTRLESRLNRLLLRLIEFAGREKIIRLECEKRERIEAEKRARAEELARRQKELKARQDAEQARVDGLLAEMESWQRSRLLREYIGVVQAGMEKQMGGPIPTGSDQGQWLRWATAQADRLDPLTPSPSSVLDERI